MALTELQYIEQFKCKPNQALSEAFNVQPSNYDNLSISDVGFSVRAYNCLKRKGINTFSELLQLTGEELSNTRNLGLNTVQEIFDRCRDLIENREKLLSNNDKNHNRLKDILDDIVSEIVKEIDAGAIQNSDVRDLSLSLCSFFHDSDARAILSERVNKEYENCLPDIQSINKADDILSCFNQQTLFSCLKMFDKYKSTYYSQTVDPISISKEIKRTLEDINSIERRSFFNEFLCWINIDLNTLLNNSLDTELDSRKREVLLKRIRGYTLEIIGEKMSLTRERVRQIELQALEKLEHILYRNGYIWLLVGLIGESGSFSRPRLNDFLSSENADLVWRYLKENNLHNICFYSAELDTIIVGENCQQQSFNLSNKVALLPDKLTMDEFDQYQLDLIAEGFEDSLVINEFKVQFIQYPKLLTREKMTFSDMCSYILEHDFEEGFDFSKREMIISFHKHLKDCFDYTGELSEKYLYNTISSCSYQIGKNMFKHLKYMPSNTEAITYALEFFETSGRNVMSYTELYTHLKETLELYGVTNEFILHSMIAKSGTKYKTSRDYIKKKDTDSFDEEFLSIIKSLYPVNISKICDIFCFSEIQCRQVISRCSKLRICGPMIIYNP